LFGCVFAIMCVLDDGIEMAVGVHAINNVFSSIFVTSESSVLQTPALFLQKEVDPKGEFWVLLVTSIIFLAVMKYIRKWDLGELFKKVQEPVIVENKELAQG